MPHLELELAWQATLILEIQMMGWESYFWN